MTRNDFNTYIQNNDFKNLFNEMGYDHANGIDVHLDIDGERYDFTAVAQKSGFVVFTSQVDEIPSNAFCKQLDSKLRKRANDYILIVIKSSVAPTNAERANDFHHLWCVPVKTVEKRNLVSIEYTSLSQTEFLFSKIDALSFGLEEEVTITDVTSKIQNCFTVNSEKVTKDFYTGFKKQHTNFEKFIKGIPESDNENRQWYASVMLNRLMFCYFIQKKGFLDFDPDYLQNKLKWSKEQQGKDKFFKSFYKNFLTHLFAGGLNDPAHDKNAEFKKIFGRIPYLNGGMFDQHEIEKQYADLDIEDKAFEDLFDFFDTYRWHLDTRIESSGKDINPDVLGYIFEQYINDRAKMGAYYTKEDITNYIGKNCIIPYLLEQVKEKCPADFGNSESNGYVWNHLKQSGLRYIYPAVQKGYSADWKNKIPADIAKGLKENCFIGNDASSVATCARSASSQVVLETDTLETLDLIKAREHWNEPTPSEFSLPTEIWRETIERLERCDAIANKIAAGEITQINDFITYNLDIISFAQDLIENAKSIDFVKAFYHALQNVTILDPTCGSGAFLFAALNILEPLYDLCLDAMERLGDTTKNEEIKKHFRSNRAYFIYKSIILRNLYGVDIMKEAVEIAKLRLFLKMVAVVEVNAREENLGLDPLPDVDFNIRCGNTLVGCVTKKEAEESSHIDDMFAKEEYAGAIKDAMKKVAETAEKFRKAQLIENGELTVDNCNTGREDTLVLEIKKAKQELTNDLADLNEKLNRQQYAASTGIILSEKPTEKQMQEYSEWLKKTQPFHWIAEFFNIIENGKLTVDNEEMPRGFESANAASLKKGGFDVIIGNPPYVEYNEKKFDYKIEGYGTRECGNLYAFVIERTKNFSYTKTRLGYIVPSASICTPRMEKLTKILQSGSLWSSIWDERPSKLFDGVDQQLCIHIMSQNTGNSFVTKMNHWAAESRNIIFENLSYNSYKSDFRVAEVIPKIQESIENEIIEKLLAKGKSLVFKLNQSGNDLIYYKNAGGRYWRLVKSFPTYYKSNKGNSTSTEKSIHVNASDKAIIICGLSSNTFYWFWRVVSNCRHLTNREFEGYSIPETCFSDKKIFDKFLKLYEDDLNKNKRRVVTQNKANGEIQQDFYYMKKSKPIIDKIDTVLASHYGFTQEELDFIINYDIKYRMGDNLNDAE